LKHIRCQSQNCKIYSKPQKHAKVVRENPPGLMPALTLHFKHFGKAQQEQQQKKKKIGKPEKNRFF
jgi:hypothetical protein